MVCKVSIDITIYILLNTILEIITNLTKTKSIKVSF